MIDEVGSREYIECLGRWIESSKGDLSVVPGRPDLVCYGTGYENWGVQTQQKAFAAYAVYALLMEPEGKGELMDTALKMLRFTLETHIEGPSKCMDGTKWGHTWISALGTERMMAAADAIADKIPERDKALFRKVMVSEADWLLENHPVVASPDKVADNKPESNLWNGAFLHRVAMMYSDCPNASRYKDKGCKFLMNSISVPSDKESDALVDGRPVRDWHVGGNFQESYALIHHGYMNVGYMVICLSNIAMLHFSYKERGLAAPESLYHHAQDLWRLVKKLTFPDGRLIRIGGDTRVRYFYCQDYCIPAWLFIADKYGDAECLEFERGWFETVKREQDFNGDGSFAGKRLRELKDSSPLYYTRLESDRAATFALAALWRRQYGDFGARAGRKGRDASAFEWHDEFHGASLVRSAESVRSWVWRASKTPFGLCLPAGDSSLAEWDFNCAGQIKGVGTSNYFKLLDHSERLFKGGFITTGGFQTISDMQIGEGQRDDVTSIERIAYAALSDGASVMCMQYAKAPYRVYLKSVKGLMLPVPNDVFNGFRRVFNTPGKSLELKGLEAPYGVVDLKSKMVDVDGAVTVELLYGSGSLLLNRCGERQVAIKGKDAAGGNLYVEEICSKVSSGLRKYEAGELILDECFAMRIGGLSSIPSAVGIGVESLPAECRIAACRGADGKVYVLAANFGECDASIRFKSPLRSVEDGGGASMTDLTLKAGDCGLFTTSGN